MDRRIGLIFGLSLLLLSPLSAFAQGKSHATVSAALNFDALQPGKSEIVAVVLDVATGFHAQSHTPHDPNLIACTVSLDDNPNLQIGEPIYPPGKDETYPALGIVNVYTGKTTIFVPVTAKSGSAAGPITLSGKLHYQACNDQLCFAPQNLPFTIDTRITAAGETASPTNADLFPAHIEESPAATPAKSDSQFSSIAAALGAAFLAGLLFNVMPCVLPVLPLKAIGFYEVSQHRRGRCFLLGVVFSLGLISIFAVLSVFVLVFHAIKWGEIFSKPWFVWPMVALLAFLATGLMGGWNFRLPMGAYTLEPRHDTIGGNFFWGALTAILATPCTAPLLPVVLAWAIARPLYEGIPAMLTVGVGMASPYLLLSAMPELARKFPRTGPWSELFKQMMGFLLLATAMYFAAGRLVHGPQFWWLVAAVVAIGAVFLVVRTMQLAMRPMPICVSVVLALVMIGTAGGWAARLNRGGVAEHFQPFSQQAFDQARSSGKIVLVKFTANWCGSCQYIEGTVFRDPKVWDYLDKNQIVAFKADLTDDNPPADALLKQLNPTGGIPLTAIYAAGAGEPIQISSVYTSQTLLERLGKMTR